MRHGFSLSWGRSRPFPALMRGAHRTVLAATGLLASLCAQSLTTGDIAFTAFNADEDGVSFVTFVDLAPTTVIWLREDEWGGGSFNTGETGYRWEAGATIAAGTVVRLSTINNAKTFHASVGTLSRVPSAGAGIANNNETVYAYVGTDFNTPTSFLAAIANGPENVATGLLTNTGLVDGVSAVRLTPSADWGEYIGPRNGLSSISAYKSLVADTAHWVMDTTNGNYATAEPNTTAFHASSPVPEPTTGAMLLAGLLALGTKASRQQRTAKNAPTI